MSEKGEFTAQNLVFYMSCPLSTATPLAGWKRGEGVTMFIFSIGISNLRCLLLLLTQARGRGNDSRRGQEEEAICPRCSGG
jgi:hypothetical protein